MCAVCAIRRGSCDSRPIVASEEARKHADLRPSKDLIRARQRHSRAYGSEGWGFESLRVRKWTSGRAPVKPWYFCPKETLKRHRSERNRSKAD